MGSEYRTAVQFTLASRPTLVIEADSTSFIQMKSILENARSRV
jgi:hypothetical protein